MSEFTGPLATAFGTYYPKGYVVAVIHERANIDHARAALESGGFAREDVRVFTGAEVLEIDRRYHEQAGLVQRIAGHIASDERTAGQEYLEEARQDRHIVTIHATTTEQVHAAQSILKEHSGHLIRYYGKLAITDLD
jgi:hypothetical protein